MRVQQKWLKYSVRKKIVQFSKVKAKQRRERINSNENKLKVAEEEQSETQNIKDLNNLENLKTEYEKQYDI